MLSDEERVDKNVEAESVRICRARHLERGNPSTVGAGRAKLLCRCHFILCIQNEARRGGADQFRTEGAECIIERRHCQIQDSLQAAFDRENQIGITRNTLQLSIGCREECFRFEQRRQLAVGAVEHQEGMRRIVPTSALNSAYRGQRRVTPFVCDDAVTETRVFGQRSALQYPD